MVVLMTALVKKMIRNNKVVEVELRAGGFEKSR